MIVNFFNEQFLNWKIKLHSSYDRKDSVIFILDIVTHNLYVFKRIKTKLFLKAKTRLK